MDASHIEGGVPLACQQVSTGDAVLGGLHGGHEGAEAVDLDGVALREELHDTARHLLEHASDDIVTIDGVVVSHVAGEAVKGDSFLLLSLGIVLSVTGVERVVVHAEVDSELGIFYCHCFLNLDFRI